MNLDAEQYYELLLQKSKNPENPKNNPENDSDNSDNKDDGSNKEQNNKKDSGTPKLSDIQSNIQLDDHDLWNERCETSNKNLQNASIANMIKNAVDNTIASRGVIPNNISKIIELHIQEPVVMWQQELKNIVGERRSDRTKTHKRPNRRFPNRMELRGNKKDELFTLVCILDVSGSHNTTSIINGLSEVRELCKITSSTIKIIQVDTQVHSVDEFDINTTSITRKANGGTEIYPAIEYIYKNDIEHDVIVVITDGGIESLRSWRYHPSCRVIFLVTDDIDIPNLADYNYSQFSIVQ
jgi:predicted metal-dependent peptidase